MSKNQNNFFKRIKPWAEYKNFILDYYLKPYFAKTKKLTKPILIVDCCSGPGKFEDGTNGSPLLIAKHLKENTENGINCRGLFIERRKVWFEQLKSNLDSFSSCCETRKGDFKNYWDEICGLANSHTIFVYLDPFGVEDLLFDNFVLLLETISKSTSIELLFNWNCIGFLRWAIAALKGRKKAQNIFQQIDARYTEEVMEIECTSIESLNLIANGDYWKDIINSKDTINLHECEKEMMGAYLSQFPIKILKGNYAIRPKYGTLPKYHLIFFTRSHEALFLMNDTMAKARRNSLNKQFVEDFLFDLTPQEVKEEKSNLKNHILEAIENNPDELFEPVVISSILQKPDMFAKFEHKDFTEALRNLRKDVLIIPNTGKKILPVKYRKS